MPFVDLFNSVTHEVFRPEILPTIAVLVMLEAILSADNAVALASIVRSLPDPEQEAWALRYGLIGAFVLRVILILTATWVINYWQFELAGAVYLLWLSGKFFIANAQEHEDGKTTPMASKMWEVIVLVSLTDLAFSLDSVTAAVAVAEETWLVLLGGIMGIIALRFLANLFIKWLEIFAYLESAGYLIVALVGMRLLLKVVAANYVPPEWLMLTTIGLIFVWGFSKRITHTEETELVAAEKAEEQEVPPIEVSN